MVKLRLHVRFFKELIYGNKVWSIARMLRVVGLDLLAYKISDFY